MVEAHQVRRKSVKEGGLRISSQQRRSPLSSIRQQNGVLHRESSSCISGKLLIARVCETRRDERKRYDKWAGCLQNLRVVRDGYFQHDDQELK